MNLPRLLLIALIASTSALAADDAAFTPLQQGSGLSGWQTVAALPGGFRGADGQIIIAPHAEGCLRLDRFSENFILQFDRQGDAPLLVWADGLPAKGSDHPRGVEVRLPAGSATGGWTHYTLDCEHGRVTAAVDGGAPQALVAQAPLQRGYVCLVGGAGEVRYRGLAIKTLKLTGLAPDKIAERFEGFRPLCPGPGFEGWKLADVTRKVWHLEGTHILAAQVTTPRAAGEPDLWTEQTYTDFELYVDWRLTMKPILRALPTFQPNGLFVTDANGKTVRKPILNAGDSGVYLRGSGRYQVNIWSQPMGSGDINELHKDPKVPEEIRRAAIPKVRADAPFGEWNRFHIRLTGERLTVWLNGILIIDNARMPGIAPHGPIALQHEFGGSPIEFANLYIRELNRPVAGGELQVYKETADGQNLTAEILKPAGWTAHDRRPAGVYFHGGSWSSGSPAQLALQARHFAERGMVGVLIKYRLLEPRGHIPPTLCMEDAKSAMRWVRAHAADLGIDPDRIAAVGASAGGQMAAFLADGQGFDDAGDDLKVPVKPEALVLFNPVVDFAPGEFGHEMMGADWQRYSPLRFIGPGAPPTLLMVGSVDKILPSLERYRAAMAAAGSRCELKVYPGQGHSFFNQRPGGNPYFDQTLAAADAFLTSLGWIPAS